MRWFTRIWVGLAIVLPILFGLMLTFAPQQVASPTTTLDSLAGMVGARDLIYSGVLIAAVFLLDTKAVGILMVGRGCIDLTDGIGTMASGGVSGMAVVPLVVALVSFIVAYLLLRNRDRQAVPILQA